MGLIQVLLLVLCSKPHFNMLPIEQLLVGRVDLLQVFLAQSWMRLLAACA